MGYARLIDTGLARAFNQVKDLAKDALLDKTTGSDFDFGTGETVGTKTTLPVKIIIVEAKNKPKEDSTSMVQMLIKATESGNLSSYDRITVEGVSYKVVQIVKTNGYLHVINVAKGPE